MKQEKSCGAVIYSFIDGKCLYLVIKMQLGHFSLVKGHVEKNETEVETAKREIHEETNLSVDLDSNFRETIAYSPYQDVYKEVVFFVANASNITTKLQKSEVSESYWLDFEHALHLLTYETDKNILTKANEYILRKHC